ncbi:hypothetical protein D9758_011153 [Tetrapyrgos nigripes]|uniref:Cytochrome P450 n=1 Tax=Tetrapyrgos nigripes TaxID=182062 RepID=A0A8H5FNM4_9AGAR|nr:hypothetical protein D9758_011153 [Tetrapyrgos nigripes]
MPFRFDVESLFIDPWKTLALVALVTVVVFIFYKPNRNLPPGPKGLPVLGNVFQLPRTQQFLRFTEWKEEFGMSFKLQSSPTLIILAGPIFSLNLAGQTVVVLNSHKVAGDLLDRRSAIYSDRPRFIMAGEILSRGLLIGLCGYGDLLRKLRKATHEGFNTRASEAYQPIQEKEAAVLVDSMLKDPNSWIAHLERSAASTILTALYGMESVQSKDDPLVARINDCMHRLTRACMPGSYLVEFLPIMKYLPEALAPWKKEGNEWYNKDTAMFQGFLDEVQSKVNAGQAKLTFAARLLEQKSGQLSTTEASWLSGALFMAGSETTAGALTIFILAMRLYPNVMEKAQAEIDAVVGRDRLPTFEDRDHLPYIQAIVEEVLRWRPIAPLGLPRRAMKDDFYEGYFIPKGSLVLENIWAMNHDPTIFLDHDEFRPERFLDKTSAVNVVPTDTRNHRHVSFGFGRRICCGLNLANQSLFIDIASLLWAASIEPAYDETGAEIIPSSMELLDEGSVVRPIPFKCNIVPRSKDVNAVLEVAQRSYGDERPLTSD